jgi:hypothetical protein
MKTWKQAWETSLAWKNQKVHSSFFMYFLNFCLCDISSSSPEPLSRARPSKTAVKRKAHARVCGNGGENVCQNNNSKYGKSVYYNEMAEALR